MVRGIYLIWEIPSISYRVDRNTHHIKLTGVLDDHVYYEA